MRKREVKRQAKREWILVVYGQVVRDENDLPLLYSEEVALANVMKRPGCVMLKIGKHITLGGK